MRIYKFPHIREFYGSLKTNFFWWQGYGYQLLDSWGRVEIQKGGTYAGYNAIKFTLQGFSLEKPISVVWRSILIAGDLQAPLAALQF